MLLFVWRGVAVTSRFLWLVRSRYGLAVTSRFLWLASYTNEILDVDTSKQLHLQVLEPLRKNDVRKTKAPSDKGISGPHHKNSYSLSDRTIITVIFRGNQMTVLCYLTCYCRGEQ